MKNTLTKTSPHYQSRLRALNSLTAAKIATWREHAKNKHSLNLYDRLELLGWKRVSGNERLDFFKKGQWTVIVPTTILSKVLIVSPSERTYKTDL